MKSTSKKVENQIVSLMKKTSKPEKEF